MPEIERTEKNHCLECANERFGWSGRKGCLHRTWVKSREAWGPSGISIVIEIEQRHLIVLSHSGLLTRRLSVRARKGDERRHGRAQSVLPYGVNPQHVGLTSIFIAFRRSPLLYLLLPCLSQLKKSRLSLLKAKSPAPLA